LPAIEVLYLLRQTASKKNSFSKVYGKNLGIAFQLVDDLLDFLPRKINSVNS
jgi:geranylgeranyl pyrophosphate synthase